MPLLINKKKTTKIERIIYIHMIMLIRLTSLNLAKGGS